jgi:hypothetical protein
MKKEWLRTWFRDGYTVRDLIYQEISDTSKSVWGFRDRFDPSKVRLLDLWYELKEWHRRAEQDFIDYQEEVKFHEERERLETQLARVMPTEFDRIADELEK